MTVDTPSECPRGHALNEGTTHCTVCWIRVAPEDPIEAAARRTRRRHTILGISLLAVTGVVLGGFAGKVLGGTSSGPTIMALPLMASAAPSVPASTSASTSPDEPTTVVAVPLAATIADPVTGQGDGSCTVQVRGQEVACNLGDDQLTFTACVPAGTERIRVRTRGTSSEPWQDASYDVALGIDAGANCSSSEIAADIVISATAVEAAKWRIVGRDSDRTKLWTSPLVTLTS